MEGWLGGYVNGWIIGLKIGSIGSLLRHGERTEFFGLPLIPCVTM